MRRINLVKDPRATNPSMWTTNDSAHEAAVVDGEPAILALEADGAGRIYAEPADFLLTSTYGFNTGDVIRAQVQVRTLQQMTLALRVRALLGGAGEHTTQYASVGPTDGWVTLHTTYTITAAPEQSYFRIDIYPAAVGLPIGSGYYFRRFLIEVNTDGEYFDGSSPVIPGAEPMSWKVHSWQGEPDASYSVQNPEPISQWTRTWWETLPEAYKSLDARQNPEIGGYPLLQWMNGIGSVSGDFRQISDDLYNGVYTDPDKVPDKALQWLALMIGVPPTQRGDSLTQLRDHIKALVSIGRTAVGTRRSIEEMIQALFPGATAWVKPHNTLPHTLVIHMREVDMPEEGRAEIVLARVKRSGVIPAGHKLIVTPASSTWDRWEADAGETWDEKEKNLPRWVDADSAGVVPE